MKNFHVRRGAHWMVIFLTLTVAGCGDSGTGPTMTTSVTVGNNFFNPENIQVSPGATVTWTWAGGVSHNVTFADNAITDSSTQSTGTFATAMPTATGDYAYQCTIHPSQMNGMVTVQ